MTEGKSVDIAINKAQTLIEALPYIRQFYNKIVVVKYGGSAMLDEELKKNVIQDVALLKLVGMHPVIVHGGGKEISKWVSMMGKEPVSTTTMITTPSPGSTRAPERSISRDITTKTGSITRTSPS